MFEVIYTSTPRGIQQGATGFTFAAYTKGMPPHMLRTVERYCRYEWQNSDPNCFQENPINWLHLTLLGGTHLLSRIAATKADSTGRSNYIADHFLLQEAECRASGVGPVQVMEALKYHSSWDGEPKLLEALPVPTPNPHERSSIGAFRLAGLDPSWPAFLANILARPKGPPAYVVYSKEHEILRLLGDVFSWLPAERQWSINFTTYATESSRDDCLLRCVPAETSFARTVLDAKAGNAYDLSNTAPQTRVTPVSNPSISRTQQTTMASTPSSSSVRPSRVKPLVRGASDVEDTVAIGVDLPNPSGLVPQRKPSLGVIRFVPWSLLGCALILLLAVVIYFQREITEIQLVKKEVEERHNRQVDDLKKDYKKLEADYVELKTANDGLRRQAKRSASDVDERGDGSNRPDPKNEAMASGGGKIADPLQPPTGPTNGRGGDGSEQPRDKEQPPLQAVESPAVMSSTDLPKTASKPREKVVDLKATPEKLKATPVNLEEVLAGTTKGEKEITLLTIPEGAADYSDTWLKGLELKSEIEDLNPQLSTSGPIKTIKVNGKPLCKVHWDKKKLAVTLSGQTDVLPLLQWITFESVETDNMSSPPVAVRLKELENSERNLRLSLEQNQNQGSILGTDTNDNNKELINRMCYLQNAMIAMGYEPNTFSMEFKSSGKGEWKWHKDPNNPKKVGFRCTLPVDHFSETTKQIWVDRLEYLRNSPTAKRPGCGTKFVPSDEHLQCGFSVAFDSEKATVKVLMIEPSSNDKNLFRVAENFKKRADKAFENEDHAWAYANYWFWEYLRGTNQENEANRKAFKSLADGVSVSKVMMEFVKSGAKNEPPVAVTLK